MAAYAPSNAIIISDIRANILRIAEIIDSMDQSAVKKTQLVKLKYGVSTDVVEMLKTLEKSRRVMAMPMKRQPRRRQANQ